MTKQFYKCFKHKSNKWLLEYMDIISKRIQNPLRKKPGVETHHIIPRSWFRENGLKVDNSKENIVNLTVSEHLDAHFSLVRYFSSIGDRKMFSKMFFALHMMFNMTTSRMQRIRGYSDKDYDRYEKLKRRHSFEMRKRTVYSLKTGLKKRIKFFDKTPRGYTSSFDIGKKVRDRVMSVKITFKGRTMTRREWARLLGTNESTIRTRQAKGLDVRHSLGLG